MAYRSPPLNRAPDQAGLRARYRGGARLWLYTGIIHGYPRREPLWQVFGQSPKCCIVVGRGIDGARGSLVLMSNEPMIRGGGPEAWRHLDLADEAQSKPLRSSVLLPFPALPFSPSASSYSTGVLLLLLQRLFPLAVFPPRPVHEPVSAANFHYRSRKSTRSPISRYRLPRTNVSLFRAFLEPRDLRDHGRSSNVRKSWKIWNRIARWSNDA